MESTRGYYIWRKRGKSAGQLENETLVPIVLAAHRKSKETYGARRIAKKLGFLVILS